MDAVVALNVCVESVYAKERRFDVGGPTLRAGAREGQTILQFAQANAYFRRVGQELPRAFA
eukprot:6285416-Lingulodinium_polyedra.AAC.1